MAFPLRLVTSWATSAEATKKKTGIKPFVTTTWQVWSYLMFVQELRRPRFCCAGWNSRASQAILARVGLSRQA